MSAHTSPHEEPTPSADKLAELLNASYEALLDIEGGLSPIIKAAYFYDEQGTELSGLGPLLNMVRLRAMNAMNKIAIELDTVKVSKGGNSE